MVEEFVSEAWSNPWIFIWLYCDKGGLSYLSEVKQSPFLIISSANFHQYFDLLGQILNWYYRVVHEMIQHLWSLNKILISITILQTNMQKERPLYGDLFSVNHVYSMTTITSSKVHVVVVVVLECRLLGHGIMYILCEATFWTEAMHSTKMSIHTRSKQLHNPEGGILHVHPCENFKSYLL
jgi:hypothetical protein